MKKLVLPDFQLSKRQPKVPNRHHTLATCTIKNEYGVPTKVTVAANWPRSKFYVYASQLGYRASNTLSTGDEATVNVWVNAVRRCAVAVADDG